MSTIKYQSGFGNHFSTESIKNTLPMGQNTPQEVAHGLYTEQINGSAFTAAKHKNLRSWLYRILPSVKQSDFLAIDRGHITCPADKNDVVPPNQFRWSPLPIPDKKTDFIAGWHTYAVNGNIGNHQGAAIHLYACNQSMTKRFFYNADGELLIVPQEGELRFHTELGLLDIAPGELLVIPRGIKFRVELKTKAARGYICENFGHPFSLPERGPIGANGLANERDFQYPMAHYEDKQGEFYLDCKFFGNLWRADLDHSPLDVVAWHGNYAPYKYDLNLFCPMNAVLFDHADPSIFTVLTSPSNNPGTANVDFVIFPERWVVGEHTFRPPYYHRNTMSEFMGLIYGSYDAKQSGFQPAGVSVHNCMSAHGPDKKAYEQGIKETMKPKRYKDTLSIMFESCLVWQPTEWALASPLRQREYLQCWAELRNNFK